MTLGCVLQVLRSFIIYVIHMSSDRLFLSSAATVLLKCNVALMYTHQVVSD